MKQSHTISLRHRVSMGSRICNSKTKGNSMRKPKVNRVNKGNRPTIIAHIRYRFTEAQMDKGKVTLGDIWDAQSEIQKAFNISGWQSIFLTWEQIDPNIIIRPN